jgi:predicted glutamine amidotransferase
MSFCFGLYSNDAGVLTTAFEPFAKDLMAEDARRGWGMGYYQAAQPLFRKQPRSTDAELFFADKVSDLRASLLLGHVRPADAVNAIPENTAPFRYQNWFFSSCGQFSNFDELKAEMVGSVPEYMRRNIKGSTPGECLFHLFLAFLNDTGKVNDPKLGGQVAARALTSTLNYLDRLMTTNSVSAAPLACVVTNGRLLLAVSSGLPLCVSRHTSYNNVGRDADGRPLSYPHLKAVAILAGKPPRADVGWESVSERAVVCVDSELNIEHHS